MAPKLSQVIVDRIRSEWSKIVSGIPQGSVLGPILFLIYISDIGEDLSAKALVYVDDTKINLDITAMIAYVSAMTNGRYLQKL